MRNGSSRDHLKGRKTESEAEREDEEDEEEHGERKPMWKSSPKEPTKEEKEDHNKTHLPFRNWCRHCIMGRGKEEACKKQDFQEIGVPEVHMDFMFMGEEGAGAKTLVFLVARERTSRATFATVAPRKSSGEWLAKRVLAWMREIGCEVGPVTVKSDNEPALLALIDHLARLRAAKGASRMMVENSPVFSSKSNGIVERAVQSVQGLIRTLRSSVEDKWSVKLPTDHAIWPWLAEYAGYLLTRAEVGKDGRTAYERLKGKKARLQGHEFAEAVYWKRRPEGGPLGKLTCLWNEGVYLGVKPTTGELIIGDERGVWRTRTTRRRCESERWAQENVKKIAGVPWKTHPDDSNADGEDLKMDVTVMDAQYREVVSRNAMDNVPKSAQITKQDLEQLGYTVGCQGCVAILRGTARQTHAAGCRKRLEDLLKDTEKVKRANKKKDEFVERAIARDEELRKAKEGEEKCHYPEVEPQSMEVEPINSDISGEKRKKEDEDEKMQRKTRKFLQELAREERKRGREPGDHDGDRDCGFVSDVHHFVPSNLDNSVVREPFVHCRFDYYHLPQDVCQVPDHVHHLRHEHHYHHEHQYHLCQSKNRCHEASLCSPGEQNFIGEFEVNDAEGEFIKEFVAEGGEGDQFDPKLLEEGRAEEARYMEDKLAMFEYVSRDEAIKKGGKTPTTTRWVDVIKKNDEGREFVRSRLVARDFKPRFEKNREDLFAAMPPLEAKKLLFRMVAGGRRRRELEGKPEDKLMFIDVKKAHLNGRCEEPVYVELPMGFKGQFARINRWLYGMRKAAVSWEDDFADKLTCEGFQRGQGAPTVFFNPVSGVRLVVHGDDFTFAGIDKELQAIKGKMAQWWDIKDRGTMGGHRKDIKEITILGRRLRWTPDGLEYEADPKHRGDVMAAEGLEEDSKPVAGPATRATHEEIPNPENEKEFLDKAGARKFRGATAKLNYLAQDRPDIQYAVKEIAKKMANPEKRDLAMTKRLARYLLGTPRLVWKYGEVEGPTTIEVEVDSDWAGASDRTSTSGGMIKLGGVGLKNWSRTQKAKALSSGEAEYYALVTGCAEALGFQSLEADLGWNFPVVLKTDSTAAIGTSSR